MCFKNIKCNKCKQRPYNSLSTVYRQRLGEKNLKNGDKRTDQSLQFLKEEI